MLSVNKDLVLAQNQQQEEKGVNMTTNNQTINFTQNQDKSQQIISGLKKLVLEDNKCISYTYVSLRFGVHVKQAINILDKFVVEERNNGNTLSLNYLLSGNNDTSDNDNEIKMERFMIVNESDMTSATDWYKNGFNKHIYSVGFGEDNDQIELNFDEYDYEVKDKSDLNQLQSFRYVKNGNIELRNVHRRTAIKPIAYQKEQKTNSDDIKELDNKSKPKINSKAKNTKKNKISNMFSKNKKEVKVENEEKESDDPFGSDIEEDTKPNVRDSEPLPIDINDSDEEEVRNVKTEPIVKKRHKRQSKNVSNSSEDEEIISTKKRGKKYKRVRLISDSDSEDNKEESALDKFVSTKKETSKPIKKMQEIRETHVDEDGYVVTKTVKKEIEDEKCAKEQESKTDNKSKADNKSKTDRKSKTDTESKKNKSEDQSKETEKTKQNSKKSSEKVEKKPTKSSKDIKSKNQSSITSFFKPKQISA